MNNEYREHTVTENGIHKLVGYKKSEDLLKAHHKHHYGVEKFKWEWGAVNHLGVYAFGGGVKDKTPTFRYIRVECPKPDNEKIFGWYCYIGPIPEFEETTDVL